MTDTERVAPLLHRLGVPDLTVSHPYEAMTHRAPSGDD